MIGCDSEDAEADLTKGANQDVAAALLTRPASKGPLGGLRYLSVVDGFKDIHDEPLVEASTESRMTLNFDG